MAMQPEHASTAQKILHKLSIFNNSETLLDELVTRSKHNDSFTTVGFLNQHGFNLMLEAPLTFTSFHNLDYLLRDGIGISLALKYFSMPQGANLNGTDLIPQLVESFDKDNTDYFVLGTESPWLEKGSQNLIGENIKGLMDGFQATESYIDFLKECIQPGRFNVIILAMGMPKQEAIASRIKEEVDGAGIVICGGAIIDFQAGRFKRAPDWVKRCSLEWLYRLLKEPKRLFKRYVIGIPVFMFRIVFRA